MDNGHARHGMNPGFMSESRLSKDDVALDSVPRLLCAARGGRGALVGLHLVMDGVLQTQEHRSDQVSCTEHVMGCENNATAISKIAICARIGARPIADEMLELE